MTAAFIQIAGVFAELELSMIRERVKSGIANARAKGNIIGMKLIWIEQEKKGLRSFKRNN